MRRFRAGVGPLAGHVDGPDSGSCDSFNGTHRFREAPMARPKRNLALLELPERAPTIVPIAVMLPVTVEDLAGFELMSHCDRCGRLHRVYPGPHDLHPRMRLVDMIGTLLCRARRDGRACG